MDLTKKSIAECLLNLCENIPFNKISVKIIYETLGISKQTFYNHFKDKYDVVSWIFIQDMTYCRAESECVYSFEELVNDLNILWNRRKFYRQVFDDNSQNSLLEYIHYYDIQVNEQRLKDYYNIDELTEELKYIINYDSYGNLRYVCDWLNGKHNISPYELAKLEYKYVPYPIKESWNRKK